MSKELMDDDIRYLRKWLNEENTSPVDRVALATVLNEVINLRDRMGGSEGLHRINAHKIKFLKDQLAAAQAQIKVLREALEKSCAMIEDEWGLDRWNLGREALAQPTDDSALRFVAIIEKRTIERCAVAADKAYATDEVIAAIRKLGEQE